MPESKLTSSGQHNVPLQEASFSDNLNGYVLGWGDDGSGRLRFARSSRLEARGQKPFPR